MDSSQPPSEIFAENFRACLAQSPSSSCSHMGRAHTCPRLEDKSISQGTPRFNAFFSFCCGVCVSSASLPLECGNLSLRNVSILVPKGVIRHPFPVSVVVARARLLVCRTWGSGPSMGCTSGSRGRCGAGIAPTGQCRASWTIRLLWCFSRFVVSRPCCHFCSLFLFPFFTPFGANSLSYLSRIILCYPDRCVQFP